MRIHEQKVQRLFCLGRRQQYDLFRKHLTRAGIEHTDGLGRVVHLHSLRKTWQTWGADHGVNQRAAQDVLGHSDANLTAKVYTDRAGLGMRAEMAKLPWVLAAGSANAQRDAQKGGIQDLPCHSTTSSHNWSPRCGPLVASSLVILCHFVTSQGILGNWVQGLDLNQRPSGYEPDELPGCSTLHQGRGDKCLRDAVLSTGFCEWPLLRETIGPVPGLIACSIPICMRHGVGLNRDLASP
jgi:Phage integrase family